MVLSCLTVQGALLAYQGLGANGDAAIFSEVAPYLARDFTVCTYDRRGYSNSNSTLTAPGDLNMPHRLQRDADDAAELIAHVAGGKCAEETYSVFYGIYQTFLDSGVDAAASGFLGPGTANSTDVEALAAYHALVHPANRANAEFKFFGHEIATYTAVNESVEALVGPKEKFVVDVGEACNIPSCNISAILASEVGVDLYISPGEHLGYVSEPEGFAGKISSMFFGHGKP